MLVIYNVSVGGLVGGVGFVGGDVTLLYYSLGMLRIIRICIRKNKE